MKYERISIMAAVMWEILALLAGAILTLLTLVILTPRTWVWYLCLWIIGGLTILATFLYVPFLYLNTQFAMNDKAIILKKGVFFQSTQILYRDRIAFVTVYRNPLSPILHVSSLRITAAGGNMSIIFLNSLRAKMLADELVKVKKKK